MRSPGAARGNGLILALAAGAVSMVVIDQTTVSLALPSLQRSLDMTETQMVWVVNAYVLALASLVAVGGRLGDMFGRTKLFRIGAILFVAGSAASGLAPTTWWILGARVVQGAGAAVMLPASSALIATAVPKLARGHAFGIATGASMSVVAIGPLLGGFLTQELGWRAVFFVNVPIGLAIITVSYLAVPSSEGTGDARFDWLGVGLLVPGLVAVVLGLTQASTWGWASFEVLVSVTAGVAALGGFVWVELRRDHPLVDLRLLGSRRFGGDSTVRALLQFAVAGVLLLSAVWIQNVVGFSPARAGVSLLPLTLPLVGIAPVAGRLYDRVGARGLAAGGALTFGLALVWIAAVLNRHSYWWIVPGLLAIGLAVGFVMVPVTADSMNAVPHSRQGQASGVFATMSELGGTLGLAVLGTLVAVVQAERIDAFLKSAGADPTKIAATERFLAEFSKGNTTHSGLDLVPGSFNAAATALTSATAQAFYVAGSVMLVASAVAWVALRRFRSVRGDEVPVSPSGS